MSQYVATPTKAFPAAGAISQFARVKLDAGGTVSVAVLADKDIGTALNAALAAGDVVNVKLRAAGGTEKMIALAAIARGATAFTAAAGKVSVTAVGSFIVGTALEASTADGDVIEVLRNSHGDTAQ